MFYIKFIGASTQNSGPGPKLSLIYNGRGRRGPLMHCAVPLNALRLTIRFWWPEHNGPSTMVRAHNSRPLSALACTAHAWTRVEFVMVLDYIDYPEFAYEVVDPLRRSEIENTQCACAEKILPHKLCFLLYQFEHPRSVYDLVDPLQMSERGVGMEW
jgi:hypothetical protein